MHTTLLLADYLYKKAESGDGNVINMDEWLRNRPEAQARYRRFTPKKLDPKQLDVSRTKPLPGPAPVTKPSNEELVEGLFKKLHSQAIIAAAIPLTAGIAAYILSRKAGKRKKK